MIFSVMLLLSFNSSPQEEEKIQKVVYLKNIFGHIHRHPNIYSTALSTVKCGHPVKVMKKDGKIVINNSWYYASVGPYKGFVQMNQTSDKRESCFQDKYPRFFDRMDFGLTDFYRWGKLHALFLRGTSRTRQ